MLHNTYCKYLPHKGRSRTPEFWTLFQGSLFILSSFPPFIHNLCMYICIFFHINFGLFAFGIGRSAILDTSGSSRCMLQRSCEILFRYQTVFDLGSGERTLPSNQFILQTLYRPGALQFGGYILKFRKTKTSKENAWI